MSDINSADIVNSYELIQPFIHKTPLVSNRSINLIAGCDVYFKLESLQKTGSFKIRGAINSLLHLSENEKALGVATHSSGNHAGALAYAAKLLGIKAYIVMPNNSSKVKIDAVRGYGADITFCSPTLKDREDTLQTIINETGATFIPPYNYVNIIKGAATCVYEISKEIDDFDYIISPIGGGGLASGSALSTKYFTNAIFMAAEPEGALDAYESLTSGVIVPSINPNTICDGLRTSLGELTFKVLHQLRVQVLPVSDSEVKSATKLIAERMKYVVEPSSAITLAAVIRNQELFKQKKVCVIISGGNLDLESFYK